MDALAEAGVVAIVGPDTSALVIAIGDRLVASEVPLVSPTATAVVLSWRTCASDNLQGAVLAGRMRRDGIETLAIIHVGDPYGVGLAATIDAEFTADGGQVLATVEYPDDQRTDFDPQVAELLAPGIPDAIVVVGFALDSAGDVRAVRARPAAGAVILGMTLIAPGSRTDDPNLVRFEEAYRAKLGKTPFRTEFTYDAIYLIALALTQAGDNTASAVRDHLREVSRADPGMPAPIEIGVGVDEFVRATANQGADLDFGGASGAIDFDDAGDVTAATFTIREVVDSPDGLRFADLESISVP